MNTQTIVTHHLQRTDTALVSIAAFNILQMGTTTFADARALLESFCTLCPNQPKPVFEIGREFAKILGAQDKIKVADLQALGANRVLIQKLKLPNTRLADNYWILRDNGLQIVIQWLEAKFDVAIGTVKICD